MPNLASGALSAAGPLATLRERLVAGPGALPRIRREEILAAAASAQRTLRELSVQARALSRLGCPPAETEAIAALRFEAFDAGRAATLDLAARLVGRPASVAPADVDRLRGIGLGDEEILEIVQTAALGRMLGILSAGLDPEDEAPPPEIAAAFETAAPPSASHGPSASGSPPGPWIRAEALSPEAFPPFAVLKQTLGFVPGVFRAQTLARPALEAQIDALRPALLAEDGLGRVRREVILLAAAAAADDAYSAGLHAELLRQLGVGTETVGAVAAGRTAADVSDRDAILLAFAERLASRPAGLGEADVAALRSAGLTDEEIRDAIVSVAFGAFLGTLAAGLGVRPDFRPPREALEERRRASAAAAPVDDPDAALVASARAGDEAAFEALLGRHQARVYRTIAGMTGSAEEAEDGCQVVFLRAFRGIAEFAGASLFATWLTRIAIRESLDRLRRRHPTESLDAAADDEDFRPSLVDPWVEDPERLYAREEMRRLVRRELGRLPVIYRAAVMLRDIEQLSTSEAAAALELPVPTLKTRLLRGRLLLREALAAHFVQSPAERRGGGVV